MPLLCAALDLNVDLGEGYPHDEALLDYASSINLACGGHAGDAETMLQVSRWALMRNVSIGAHPGYADRENFGRREQHCSPAEIYASVQAQIGVLHTLVQAAGGQLSHVKPHGALYNQAARDRMLARTLATAVRDYNPALQLYALAGSELVRQGRLAGLIVVEEVFADRGYCADGSLVSRQQPGALLDSRAAVLDRVSQLVLQRTLTAIDGSLITLPDSPLTVCLHGDTPDAPDYARALRARLQELGVQVLAPTAGG